MQERGTLKFWAESNGGAEEFLCKVWMSSEVRMK